jgi:hypothetical protein
MRLASVGETVIPRMITSLSGTPARLARLLCTADCADVSLRKDSADPFPGMASIRLPVI